MCYQQLNSSTPVARKVHRCDECSREIRPGRRYHNSVGLAEGAFQNTKQCLRCHAIVKTVYSEQMIAFGECYYPGELRTTLRDYWAAGWRALRARLREAAGAKGAR